MDRPRAPILRPRRGFTLIEILVVVGIIMILTALGISMSGDMVPRWRTRSAAMQFAAHAQQCRMLAVRSGVDCAIWLQGYDANPADLDSNDGYYQMGLLLDPDTASWDVLPADSFEDASDDDQSMGFVDLGDPTNQYYARRVGILDWGSISGPDDWNFSDDHIGFDARGFVINTDSDFVDGYIKITFINKVARSKGLNEDWTVFITRAGMTRIVVSGDSIGTLQSGTTQYSTP